MMVRKPSPFNLFSNLDGGTIGSVGVTEGSWVGTEPVVRGGVAAEGRLLILWFIKIWLNTCPFSSYMFLHLAFVSRLEVNPSPLQRHIKSCCRQTRRSSRRVTEPLWRAKSGSPMRLAKQLRQFGDRRVLSSSKGLSAKSYSA
ncbi:hypothetical protein H5410_027302 [Solanum commersonii]|uniref:Uncharacterized protein n=1 Tax=Solanum commersonii TaxID=4109 RepID=A0A9J5YZI0_SOLCO|nr:hypothetical protein H5410_027302 [Solanum commersonii]